MNVIEACSLGKRYRGTWALRECTLAIPAGHVAALVGPNGAGKTTLLNLAVGLAAPSAGGVSVLGGRPAGPAALDGIAFVAQDTPLYKNLSAADMLHLTASLNRRFDRRYAETRLAGRCPAARLDSDAVEHAVIGALASFCRDQHDLIAEAITSAQASYAAVQDGRRAELAAAEHDLARTSPAIDRYLAAFENGTLDPEDLAVRLTQLKSRSGQLRSRRDELADQVAAAPTAPPAATLRQVADHIADIVASGSYSQRKALIEALIAQIKITAPDRIGLPHTAAASGEPATGAG